MPWYVRLWWWLGNRLVRDDARRMAAAFDVLGREAMTLLEQGHAPDAPGYTFTDVKLGLCDDCGRAVLRMTAVGGPRDGESLQSHIPDHELPDMRAAFVELEARRCSS